MCNLAGEKMYKLAKQLFPICRSITGNGVRETLKILQESVPEMTLHEVPSGASAFDWTVPKEWNITDGWIKYQDGTKVVDFKKNNLHVMGYSSPIDKTVTLDELQKYLFSLPDYPDWIPYMTSYYKERTGFCISQNMRDSLKEGEYHIHIDSSLSEGTLTYGEVILKGETDEEVFFSTYVCHPSMANNELSGPCLAVELINFIKSLGKHRYTYRIIFIPETIGSIVYLSKNLETLKSNVIAGFVLTCVGDDKAYSYMPSRYGNTLSDKVAINTLKSMGIDYTKYSFLERGSDERQYCSPGVDLPVCSVNRSLYKKYPEYHTSADDLSFISVKGLQGIYDVYTNIILTLENNYKYKIKCLCEPQLGKRGLYPTESYKGSATAVQTMMDFIAYADGTLDLIQISEIINAPIQKLVPIIEKLSEAQLITKL